MVWWFTKPAVASSALNSDQKEKVRELCEMYVLCLHMERKMHEEDGSRRDRVYARYFGASSRIGELKRELGLLPR